MNTLRLLCRSISLAAVLSLASVLNADPAASQKAYHEAGKTIAEMVINQKVEAGVLKAKVDIMVTEATALAKAYAAKHPKGAKLLQAVLDHVPEMKTSGFSTLEKRWHDLEFFRSEGNDPGLDLSEEDNEHFTDPIHAIVHPLLVLKAGEAFLATSDAKHLKVMKEELEEGLEQAEKTREALER